MSWFAAFGILGMLAILPLGIQISYDAGGLVLKVAAGPVKLTVYPRPKKKPKEKPDSKEQKKAAGAEENTLPQPPEPPKQELPKGKKQQGGSAVDFIPLLKVGIDFLGDFRRKLRLNALYLRLILGSSDPYDLAVNYGKTWAAVGNLMPVLERCFVIKKRDVEVECDFTALETKIIARLEITITLGRLLALTLVYGIRAFKEYLSLRNKRKGGVAK